MNKAWDCLILQIWCQSKNNNLFLWLDSCRGFVRDFPSTCTVHFFHLNIFNILLTVRYGTGTRVVSIRRVDKNNNITYVQLSQYQYQYRHEYVPYCTVLNGLFWVVHTYIRSHVHTTESGVISSLIILGSSIKICSHTWSMFCLKKLSVRNVYINMEKPFEQPWTHNEK